MVRRVRQRLATGSQSRLSQPPPVSVREVMPYSRQRGEVLNPLAGLFCMAAGFLLRGRRVDKLLNALRHVATLVALQVVQLVCCRLGSMYALHRHGIDRTVYSKHAGDSAAPLPDRACATGPSSSRRAANSVINLTLEGLGEASHGS